MPTDIEYSPEIPPELLSSIQPILESLRFAMPPWLTHLYVKWNRDIANAAEIEVLEPYLKASLHIGPGFLDWSPAWRKQCLAHEIAHLYTSAAVDGAREAYRQHLDGPSLQYAEKMSSHTLERATEWLGRVFAEMAGRGKT